MKLLPALSLLIILQLSAHNRCLSQLNSFMTPFQWIVGKWHSTIKEGKLVETWQYSNDSTLSGKSIIVKNSGDSIITETIELQWRKGKYYYTPTTANQNNRQAIPFQISDFSATGFTAENKTHDFPQRISYTLVEKNRLHAFVDGSQNNTYRKESFDFTRE